jgi:hypothetical protein
LLNKFLKNGDLKRALDDAEWIRVGALAVSEAVDSQCRVPLGLCVCNPGVFSRESFDSTMIAVPIFLLFISLVLKDSDKLVSPWFLRDHESVLEWCCYALGR